MTPSMGQPDNWVLHSAIKDFFCCKRMPASQGRHKLDSTLNSNHKLLIKFQFEALNAQVMEQPSEAETFKVVGSATRLPLTA